MIDHCHEVIREGVAPRRSAADSIALLAVLDRLREAAGSAAQSAPGTVTW
jgi:hypothetical protein